jgi:hypothetical protein
MLVSSQTISVTYANLQLSSTRLLFTAVLRFQLFLFLDFC